MAIIPAKDAEPIAGYRLLEKLGIGGYGEVWKVTAPGGLTKALKIVYGDMSGSRAEQELKALERIKEVRHPFLLSLERIEIIDNQLFILTELADGCLTDRFYECRKAGLKGIPRDEMLGYLRDAADALDYMSEHHGLQHLDIKPQNLLLVGKRIKVADFGLVKNLVGTSVTASGGVTPVYATPEAFDGRVTRYSDQYSLAIVYQEMLTGVRPFPGTTLMQLAAQHLNSPPMLSPLPVSDRTVIAKALAKIPEHRFASCLKMVEALLAGGRSGQVSFVEPPEPRDNAEHEPPASVPGSATVAGDRSIGPGSLTPRRTLAGHTAVRPGESQPSVVAPAPCLGPPTVSDPTAVRPRSQPPEQAREPPKPGLRPTLFLGIGGLAAATLRRLKTRLCDKYGGASGAPIFRLLLVDTDREDLRQARLGNPAEALETAETLFTPLHPPEHYRAESRSLLRWLDRRWFYGISRSLLTEGLRPVGRLALVTNADAVLTQIRESLTQITSAEALSETVNTTNAEIRDATPQVFLVASVAGGTGGGMLLTMAYAVRQALRELGYSSAGLCGMLLYATSPKLTEEEMARVNAHATLSELTHFSRCDAAYPGDPEYGLAAFEAGQAPFDDTYLIPLGEHLAKKEVEGATEDLAEYLSLDASPNGGAILDQLRRQTRVPPSAGDEPFCIRSFGLTRIGVQGERPIDLATRLLCQRVTERWVKGPREAESQFLEREAQRQAGEQGLTDLALGVELPAVVAKVLGEPLEVYYPKLKTAAAEVAKSNLPYRLLPAIDGVFGAGADLTSERDIARCPFQAAVRKAIEDLGARKSRALQDWFTRLVEMPGKRFKAVERSGGFLMKEIALLTERARSRLAQTGEQRQALSRQIDLEKAGPRGSGFGWFSRVLGGAPPTEDKLLDYCRACLQEAAEASAVLMLGVVHRELMRFLQEVSRGQQQIKQFAEQFRPSIKNEAPPNAPTVPLPQPAGAQEGPEGSDGTSEDNVPPEVVFRFDHSFQVEVLDRLQGMWRMFVQPTEPVQAGASARPTLEMLTEDLLIRARSTIQRSIKDLNSAEMFLRINGGGEKARPLLLNHLDSARLRLRAVGGREHLVAALPEGESGNILREMITSTLRDIPITVVQTEEEVILSYESADCPLQEAVKRMLGHVAIPPELVRGMLTRQDVAWTFPETGSP
jgi:serine/threonine protein kinase